MSLTILMGGDNIHGRIMVDELVKAGVVPDLIINEENTPRAAKLQNWLANDIDTPPSVLSIQTTYLPVQAFDGQDSINAIKAIKTKYLVIAGCGAIIKDNILSLATPLNIHPGILPYFRGLDPVLWSVDKGEPVGATVHIMDSGIDTGPILNARPLPKDILIKKSNNILELRLACMRWGGELLADFIKQPCAPTKQDEAKARYFSAYPEEHKASLEIKLMEYRNAL